MTRTLPNIYVKSSAHYGDIEPGERKDNEKYPFELTLSKEAAVGQEIVFDLQITAVGYNATKNFFLTVPIPFMPNWPIKFDKKLKLGTGSGILLADIDKDSREEVLFGLENKLWIFKADATFYPGWPQVVADDWMHQVSMPVVGDIDGDGDNEIVAAVNVWSGVPHGVLYAWHENGSLVQGWPKDFGRGKIWNIALFDLDNNKSDLEIVVIVDNVDWPFPSRYPLKLFVLKGDTSNLNGWPVELPYATPAPQTFSDVSVATGNIDNQAGNEIIVSTKVFLPTKYTSSPIFVYHNNGTPLRGWPKVISDSVLSPPALGNLDGGEDIEIIVGAHREGGKGSVCAFKYNGENIAGWPVDSGWDVPVVGDIDNDGELEVISSDFLGSIKVFAKNGKLIWSRQLSPLSPPSICDIDNDNKPDILFSTASNNLFAIDNKGNKKQGFPIKLSTLAYFPPSIGDLDGDGDIEVVINDFDYSYAFDLPVAKPTTMDWPMFGHDPQHTGNYHLREEKIPPSLPIAFFTATPISGKTPLIVQFTDASTNGPTSWQWDFDGDGSIDSTEQNPSHIYNTPGTYTVSLTVSGEPGTSTKTKNSYITVNNPPESLALQAQIKRNNCKMGLELTATSSLQPEAKISYKLKDNGGTVIRQGRLIFKKSQNHYSAFLSNLPLAQYSVEIESDKRIRASTPVNPFANPDSLEIALLLTPQRLRSKVNLEVKTTPYYPDNCLHYQLINSGTQKTGNLSYKPRQGLYIQNFFLPRGNYKLIVETIYGGRGERGFRVE